MTYSRLFNRSRKVLIGMREKLLVCGVHLVGSYHLAPEIPIAAVFPAYTTPMDRDKVSASFTIALCENNSIYLQRPSGAVLSTIYPPPTAQQIVSVHHSMKMNRVIAFLVSGALCFY
jgi:hypothetical protein